MTTKQAAQLFKRARHTMWHESTRKLTLGLIVYVTVTVAWFFAKADWSGYATFSLTWLGVMQVAHVADKKVPDRNAPSTVPQGAPTP